MGYQVMQVSLSPSLTLCLFSATRKSYEKLSGVCRDFETRPNLIFRHAGLRQCAIKREENRGFFAFIVARMLAEGGALSSFRLCALFPDVWRNEWRDNVAAIVVWIN